MPPGGWRAVLVPVAIGFVLRLAWFLYSRPVPVSDYDSYRLLAISLLDHGRFGYPEPNMFRVPFYPAVLAAFMLVSRSIAWLSFCNVLLSTALIPVVFRVGWRITGDLRAATWAALACALYPTFVFYSPLLASEHVFALLLFGAVLLLLSPRGASVRNLTLAGTALALATLTRGEALFYAPLLVLVPVLRGWRPPLARMAVCFLVPILLLPGSWYVRNLVRFGPGVGLSTNGTQLFFLGHHAGGQYGEMRSLPDSIEKQRPQAEAARLYTRLTLQYLREDPRRIALDAVQGTRALYKPGNYALRWNVALPRAPGTTAYPEKHLAGYGILRWVEALGFVALVILALGSVPFLASLPVEAWAIPAAVLFLNWFGYAVVFAAIQRFRFTAEAALCLLAGVTLARLLARERSSGAESAKA